MAYDLSSKRVGLMLQTFSADKLGREVYATRPKAKYPSGLRE